MKVLFFDYNDSLIHLLPNGFRDAGHDVVYSGLVDKQKIISLIKNHRPDLVVTQGWSQHIQRWSGVIRTYVKKWRIPHAYWSVEDPIFTSIMKKNVTALSPNIVFTISKETVPLYEKRGFPAAHLDFAYQPGLVSTSPGQEKRYDVAVVANSYAHFPSWFSYRFETLKTLITPLLEQGVRVDFWGRDWKKMDKFLNKVIPPEWQHGEVANYLDVLKIYQQSKINIGLQNTPMQLTMRTFDILGNGNFLLTLDTPAVRSRLVPGRDVVMTNSPAETVRLVNYYLTHDVEREKIAQSGREAVKNETYQRRAEQMIAVMKAKGLLRS